MKAIIYILIGVIVTLGLWGLFQRNQYQQSQNKVAMLNSVVDSVNAINAMPPDTIIRYDTIYSDTTIYVTTEFEKPEPDEPINHYKDSVINDEIRVWVDVAANKLFNIDWKYEPVIRERVKEIKTPYPVIVEKPVIKTVEPKGFYGVGGVGFGDGFSGRVGLGYMPNNKYLYSINVARYGNTTVWEVQVNVKLFN